MPLTQSEDRLRLMRYLHCNSRSPISSETSTGRSSGGRHKTHRIVGSSRSTLRATSKSAEKWELLVRTVLYRSLAVPVLTTDKIGKNRTQTPPVGKDMSCQRGYRVGGPGPSFRQFTGRSLRPKALLAEPCLIESFSRKRANRNLSTAYQTPERDRYDVFL